MRATWTFYAAEVDRANDAPSGSRDFSRLLRAQLRLDMYERAVHAQLRIHPNKHSEQTSLATALVVLKIARRTHMRTIHPQWYAGLLAAIREMKKVPVDLDAPSFTE